MAGVAAAAAAAARGVALTRMPIVIRTAGQANTPTAPSQLSSAVTTGVSSKDGLADKVNLVGSTDS